LVSDLEFNKAVLFVVVKISGRPISLSLIEVSRDLFGVDDDFAIIVQQNRLNTKKGPKILTFIQILCFIMFAFHLAYKSCLVNKKNTVMNSLIKGR